MFWYKLLNPYLHCTCWINLTFKYVMMMVNQNFLADINFFTSLGTNTLLTGTDKFILQVNVSQTNYSFIYIAISKVNKLFWHWKHFANILKDILYIKSVAPCSRNTRISWQILVSKVICGPLIFPLWFSIKYVRF